jgi:cytochrome c-type biogenesis protein CcmH
MAGWIITVALAAIVLTGLAMGDSQPGDRVDALGASIRCPVCQGESILDSPSATATAMLEVVQAKVAAGETDQQILTYFRSRFGDGIILDPPLAGSTLLVWVLPLLAVGGGIWMILSRRRTHEPMDAR